MRKDEEKQCEEKLRDPGEVGILVKSIRIGRLFGSGRHKESRIAASKLGAHCLGSDY